MVPEVGALFFKTLVIHPNYFTYQWDERHNAKFRRDQLHVKLPHNSLSLHMEGWLSVDLGLKILRAEYHLRAVPVCICMQGSLLGTCFNLRRRTFFGPFKESRTL